MTRGFKEWLFSPTEYSTDFPTGPGLRIFGLALSISVVIFAIAGATIAVITALQGR